MAAVVDGVGELPAHRQHHPVPPGMDFAQQDKGGEVRLGVPAEAEGGEGQPRHGGDAAEVWRQRLVAEQAAAGLRPGIVRLEGPPEGAIVRCKGGELHGEQVRGVPPGHGIVGVQLVPHPDPPRLVPAVAEIYVPVQHGGHAPHQGRVQLFAPGFSAMVQRRDVHVRRQIDGGLAEDLQILPPLPGFFINGGKGHALRSLLQAKAVLTPSYHRA